MTKAVVNGAYMKLRSLQLRSSSLETHESYWSSTEYDENNSVDVNFREGYIYPTVAKTNSNFVRAFLEL